MHDKKITPNQKFSTDYGSEPTEAKRLGNGPRPFMAHSGPEAGKSGIDRGQFSVRTKLESK